MLVAEGFVDMSRETLERAIKFYSQSPTGQWDRQAEAALREYLRCLASEVKNDS